MGAPPKNGMQRICLPKKVTIEFTAATVDPLCFFSSCSHHVCGKGLISSVCLHWAERGRGVNPNDTFDVQVTHPTQVNYIFSFQ